LALCSCLFLFFYVYSPNVTVDLVLKIHLKMGNAHRSVLVEIFPALKTDSACVCVFVCVRVFVVPFYYYCLFLFFIFFFCFA
jgi:hypothetical protein